MARRYFDDDGHRGKRRRETRPIEARIIEAVREHDALRVEAARLKAERVRVAYAGCDERFGHPGCWRVDYYDDDGNPVYPPLAKRCRACQESYALHTLSNETSKQAGVALRRLRRLLRSERDALRDPSRICA